MSRLPRKDYGCPLRIWHGPDGYTILPPRSQRASERWQHAAKPGGLPRWRGLKCWPDGGTAPVNECAGPHLGQRVTWAEVPEPVRAALRTSELAEYCPAVQL